MSENHDMAVDDVDAALGRFVNCVETQCRSAVDILAVPDAPKPVTLRDFINSLDKSMKALSVSTLLSKISSMKSI